MFLFFLFFVASFQYSKMRSSPFFSGSRAACFLALSSLTASVRAQSSSAYGLVQTYAGSNFFDGFDFFTGNDPTHGFVQYYDRGTAQSAGLISAQDGQPVRIGVDYTNTYSPSGAGRPSVRITSQQVYNTGLFVIDLNNMPGGVCGTWPAVYVWECL